MQKSDKKPKGPIVKHPHWALSLLAIVLFGVYWIVVASDRFVSESNVVLESPQMVTPELSFGSLFGQSSSGKSNDMLLLRDYLRSVDMMRIVDSEVDFQKHYSNSNIDWFSRLASDEEPLEELHEYYLSMLSVELDDYAQVLRIRVTAFSPEIAQQICKLLIVRGENYMNLLGKRLADDQVRFLEQQVDEMSQKYMHARQELIDYQNKHGIVSSTSAVETLEHLVAGLETQLAGLKAKRSVLVSFQSLTSPEVKRTDSEIKALEKQIADEQSRITKKSGNALNVTSAEYQTLELQLEFAQKSYSGALAALQNTRIEAARQLKQVSVLQSPTLPEYATEPRRFYVTFVFAIVVLFLSLIAHMLVLIVRDHQD